ncbi:MAG: RNA polymerase sigma factor [Acidimicrobiales bacterium]
MEGPADDTLVAAAQAGDQQALDTLLRRHYDRIWAVCRRLAGNDADAADATQEALITIARRIDRFDGRAAFSTWAYRVATNACLDELRRRGRRPQVGLPEYETETDIEPGATGASRPVADEVTDKMLIDDALEQLPEDFRAPVVLRDLVGMDYAEISEVLAIPPGTVRSRIARGRRSLAKILGNHNTEPQRQNPDHA